MMIDFKVILVVVVVMIGTSTATSAEYEKTKTLKDEPLQSQESFDSFGGALGSLRDHIDTPRYDDLHKYGGIGKKLLFGKSSGPLYDHSSDGYKHYYDDDEHLDQALNKYTGQHKIDKYGGKSDDFKDYHGAHVYHRNRGYGYEKHYMFDKEYSTGKHSGAHGGHHSYYGDHDHGSKHTVDAHKMYERKTVGGKSSHTEKTYKSKTPELPLYDDAGTDGSGYGGVAGKSILKHKKDFVDHHLKHHHDYHHHDHQPYSPSPVARPVAYEYIPVIDPNAGTTSGGHLYGMPAPMKSVYPPPPTPTYSTAIVEPDHLRLFHPSLYQSPVTQQQHLIVPASYDDSLYVSSANDVPKTTGSSGATPETEGESINTFSPKISSSGSSTAAAAESSATAEINTSPLISTRFRHHHHHHHHQPPKSSQSLSAESFARITTAVHATPPVISTHLYRSSTSD